MDVKLSQKKSRDDYIKELQDLDLPVGAHIILWGEWTIFHRIMILLQYLWLGVKNAPTHVQRVYDQSQDISAEGQGVMLIDRLNSLKKAKRIKIVIHKKLKESGMGETFKTICDKYLNAPYDKYFYCLVVLRIFTFFLPFLFIWTLLLNLPLISILIALLVILYWPVRKYLTFKSGSSWACSELSNSLDRDLGIDTGIDIHNNTSPLYYYRLSRAASDFKELYDSGRISD